MCMLTNFQLPAIAPFSLQYTVWALRRSPNNLLDRWQDGIYQRRLTIEGLNVDLAISQPPVSATIIINTSPITHHIQQQLAATLKLMLGLEHDLTNFYSCVAENTQLQTLVQPFIGFKPPRFSHIFEAMVNAVACQQVSLTVAIQLLNNLIRYCTAADLPAENLDYSFPSASVIANCQVAELQKLGFSRQRASALIGLAQYYCNEPQSFASLVELPDQEIMEFLTSLRGIGPWSAGYICLRGLGRISVFPKLDTGARQSLALQLGIAKDLSFTKIEELTQAWYPYAGLVYFHLLLGKLRSNRCL
jgi:DNA-3-methyladenine glycosylase II